MTPLTDRQGRFSPLKAATLALALLPAAVIAYWFFTRQLGPLPVKTALHLVGDWTIRLLVITLALTPLQRVLNYPKIALIRRMLGVTTFAYGLTHFLLYIVQSKFDLVFVATEIVLRIYLTIGFVALIGLSLLAATSFDSAIRKLGKKWKMIHRLVYGDRGAGPSALLHSIENRREPRHADGRLLHPADDLPHFHQPADGPHSARPGHQRRACRAAYGVNRVCLVWAGHGG